MSEVRLQIDGQEVTAPEGATVLEAAQGAGIPIPTLCHHEKLEPFGSCRLCTVEVERGGRKQHVVSCVYPVAEGLTVRTRTPEIERIRRVILELYLAHAPEAPRLKALAEEYGANKDRFDKESSFCIHCGLCVRYCAEVKKKHAVGFINRGTKKEVAFVPDIAARECWKCKECFPLCPTSWLQAAYVLVEGILFPREEQRA
ncbi:MAG: 2Fe-2S iron-sulfur cluster binding domain-containing protein [Deltaproteobacteria bacterium]|nr:2Fe-2S iron-sulfur cluster binding domain-containing protein [Deltaproteobacteria bacterium]